MAQGDTAVYSKTGTIGKVVRILEIDGKTWAELDSTGLLYDVNSLEASTETMATGGGKPERRESKREKEAKQKGEGGPEEIKDEGSLDSSAGVCGAG